MRAESSEVEAFKSNLNATNKLSNVAGVAEALIQNHPESQIAASARLVLASHYLALDTDASVSNGIALANHVLVYSTNNWSKVLALLQLSLASGLRNNMEDQRMFASQGLQLVDSMDSSPPPEIDAILKLTQTPLLRVKDGLAFALTSAEARLGNIDAAKKILGRVEDEEIRSTITNSHAFRNASRESR